MTGIKSGYTRVSQILSQGKDFSHINEDVFNEKCEVGTEVHENIHRSLTGGFEDFKLYPLRNRNGGILLDDNGRERWDHRGIGYFKSFMKWETDNLPEFVMMEKRFYDDGLMITGQLDGLIKDDEKYVLIDYKTSYSVDLETWNLQAHAYWYLLSQNGHKNIDKMQWIQLKKDGKNPRVCEFEYDEKILHKFLMMCQIYFEEKENGRIVD